jgi:hypothetical protein
MNILNQYYPEDQYYPPELDDAVKLYGSTNYIWNPLCCEEIANEHLEITAQIAFSIVMAFKNIQFMMVIAIAIIFSQVFISGMLLNFLIYTPYLKANYSRFIKPDQVTQS